MQQLLAQQDHWVDDTNQFFMCRQSEDANASQLKSIPSFPLLIIKLMEVDGSFRWLTGCSNDGAVSCIIHYLLIMR